MKLELQRYSAFFLSWYLRFAVPSKGLTTIHAQAFDILDALLFAF